MRTAAAAASSPLASTFSTAWGRRSSMIEMSCLATPVQALKIVALSGPIRSVNCFNQRKSQRLKESVCGPKIGDFIVPGAELCS
mmetsp:Transcript_30258/g.78255  ORF Transcript_30258/g.78255 Transcript_30258/m.78255 type:complete len:84 (+) Transcript_30258:456-707(+)